MMRVALVGLSSPFGYMYGERDPDDRERQWTPVFESPLGLAAFFDEVWFLHDSLCPYTMRGLDNVRHLNEDASRAKLIRDTIEHSYKSSESIALAKELDAKRGSKLPWPDLQMLAFEATRMPVVRVDNHSHAIRLGGWHESGNSWSTQKIATDLMVTRALAGQSGHRIELIGNTYTGGLVLDTSRQATALGVANALIVEHIPTVHTALGPETKDFDHITESPYIVAFREKIEKSVTDGKELDEIVRGIRSDLDAYRDRLLLQAPFGGAYR